ncbi:unnamed protein product [Adineta steineri]|uniref:Uncharacterized protein n=1 Tax=Adineta steineri TaxID=433720 RepID=A0A814URH5_9BILA|nr:unnamed protein product [Adineta steineri]CAF1179179.1 unnamed protein product [Adineta steineri]CAF1214879.1 unnamed protein product [Adineta steineri]CAF1246748.1 unnamed protein product [Adineta steineri]CAF1531433.1 unnamed protein product [Adineta steineri]
MAVSSTPPLPLPRIDVCSRVLIIIVSFFTGAALATAIVGLLTQYWYYSQDSNGNILYHNLFTQCSGNIRNGSSTCLDIQRDNDLGVSTLYAAAFLIVAICLIGCAMFVTLAMNCVLLTGTLLFVAPILLFLAAGFMIALFAITSRVTIFNGYSVILVQTSHGLTILSLGLIAFASGRLHTYYYERY